MLLIDELDRADEPFEAFLLEVLAEYQLTIPELGTIKAQRRRRSSSSPRNRTREIHDALKRRCLYHWVDYPDAPSASSRSCRIRAPGAPERLCARGRRRSSQRLRTLDLVQAARRRRDDRLDQRAGRPERDQPRRPRTSATRSACCSSTATTSPRCRAATSTRLLAELQANARGRAAARRRCSLRTSSTSRASCASAGVPVGPDRVMRRARGDRGGRFRPARRRPRRALGGDARPARAAGDSSTTAFAAFWRDPKLLEQMHGRAAAEDQAHGRPREQARAPNRLADALAPPRRTPTRRCPPTGSDEQVEFETSFTFSDRERLQRADFESMTAAEFELAKRIAEELPLPLAPVRRRRHEASARGRIDLRRTMLAMARQPQTLVPRFSRPRSELPT